jgi:hypothetical protein
LREVSLLFTTGKKQIAAFAASGPRTLKKSRSGNMRSR